MSGFGESDAPRQPPVRGVFRRFLRYPGAVAGFVLVGLLSGVALAAPWIAPGEAFSYSNPPMGRPSWDHPFGTDQFSRDLLKAVIQGLRTSMTVVVWVAALSAFIGGILGMVSGYVGGIVDDLIMRATELFQAVPRFFLAILVVSLYGAGLNRIVLVLGLTSWTFLARVIRAETLSAKAQGFVEAARAAGAPVSRVLSRHVLPQVAPSAVVMLMLMASRLILIEAGLAFIGLGDTNRPSLGVLANNAQLHLQQAWWLSVFPGLAIAAAVLGLNLLSDGLSQALERSPAPVRTRRFRFRDGRETLAPPSMPEATQ